jgi:uncharacterized protein (TIGR00730 family)
MKQFLRDFALLIRVSREFRRGFNFLRGTGKAVTAFGSARLPEDHPGCKVAYEVGAMLARNGYAVLTGGGVSVMGAANRGAFEAGGKSLGVNITLPFESVPNSFMTAMFHCRYFFTRKVLLVRSSSAFVFFAGGFGTLDELLEVATLIQTGKMDEKPVIVVGREYWKGFIDWCESTLLKEGAISSSDLKRLHIVDTVQEVEAILTSHI